MKKIWCVLLLLSSYVNASGVGTGASYMYDSDGNSWFNANSWYMPTNSLGVRYGKTQYYTDSVDDSANRISLVTNYSSKNVGIVGDLGVSKLNSKSFMIGDITISKPINDHFTAILGADGDVVDSEMGVLKQIVYRGYSGGFEIYNNKFGAVAMLRKTDFSDSNTRTGYVLKTYYSMFDGISMYISTKYYESSVESNPNYFSPEELRRNSLGVSYRYRLGDCLVTGYAELGYQDTPGVRETTNAFKVAIGNKFAKFWNWQIAYMTDIESTSNYRYNFVTAEIYLPL